MLTETTNTYYLKSTVYDGGVEIVDGTGGIAKASLDPKKDNSYLITVNGKKLIYPTFSNASEGQFSFYKSKKITFEKDLQDSKIIKITEVDDVATEVFYVDTNNQLVEGIAYDIYNYRPQDISKESATEKMKSLLEGRRKPFINKSSFWILYNRHGIAAVFQLKVLSDYKFCYAKPQDIALESLEADFKKYVDEEDNVVGLAVKSKNKFVNVGYFPSKESYFLNGEKANRLDY